MNRIESDLKIPGWKFNRKTRRADRIAPHRGKDYLTECVVFYYEKMSCNGNTPAIRSKIASKLGDYFSPRELSTAAGAPIHAAIRHHLKRR